MCKTKEELIIERAEELGKLAGIRKEIIADLEKEIASLKTKIQILEMIKVVPEPLSPWVNPDQPWYPGYQQPFTYPVISWCGDSTSDSPNFKDGYCVTC